MRPSALSGVAGANLGSQLVGEIDDTGIEGLRFHELQGHLPLRATIGWTRRRSSSSRPSRSSVRTRVPLPVMARFFPFGRDCRWSSSGRFRLPATRARVLGAVCHGSGLGWCRARPRVDGVVSSITTKKAQRRRRCESPMRITHLDEVATTDDRHTPIKVDWDVPGLT